MADQGRAGAIPSSRRAVTMVPDKAPSSPRRWHKAVADPTALSTSASPR